MLFMYVVAYLQHKLGLIKQLPGFLSHILIIEDLGIASVWVPPSQLPCLQLQLDLQLLNERISSAHSELLVQLCPRLQCIAVVTKIAV